MQLRVLPKNELPTGVAFGIKFTTLSINSPAHIAHLQKLLQSREYGSISFIKRRLSSLDEAFLSKNTKIVFNCTGNGASTLSGVNDETTYPTRGQIVIVKAPKVTENIMRHGKDYETYVIPRPKSGGNVILGGFMQKGNSSADVYHTETQSILKRTKELLPLLQDPEVEIMAIASGLRPSREGGARVEAEEREKGLVVHNYGAGGTGFQAGMGMAADAVDLAMKKLSELKTKAVL
jgi:D-amino-acid oxidase